MSVGPWHCQACGHLLIRHTSISRGCLFCDRRCYMGISQPRVQHSEHHYDPTKSHPDDIIRCEECGLTPRQTWLQYEAWTERRTDEQPASD